MSWKKSNFISFRKILHIRNIEINIISIIVKAIIWRKNQIFILNFSRKNSIILNDALKNKQKSQGSYKIVTR